MTFQKTDSKQCLSGSSAFKEHAKKFNLDDEEQEILADFEANHAGKPQITENRRKELAALANASYKFRASAKKPYTIRLHSGAVDVIKAFTDRFGGHYQTLVDDAVIELAAKLKAELVQEFLCWPSLMLQVCSIGFSYFAIRSGQTVWRIAVIWTLCMGDRLFHP